MASSRKCRPNELEAAVREALRAACGGRARVAVALSGGVDSVVLLDLVASLARQTPFPLSCLHVHHGLSPNAEDWARFCERLTVGYGVPLRIARVDVGGFRARGPEGAARAARYAAFRAADVDLLLLGHHRDDQAETLLLQLARGSGLAGLASMPRQRDLDFGTGPILVRPLLEASRAEIEAYARRRGLEWIEDESNANPGIPRSALRRHVMPVLEGWTPGFSAAAARSVARLATALGLLDELAAEDLARCSQEGRIVVSELAALRPDRARNLMRFHLGRLGLAVPDKPALEELVRQLVEARADAAVRFHLGDRVVRRYRGRVWIERELAPPPADYERDWCGESALEIPALGGVLHFVRAVGEGVAERRLRQPVRIRLRRGGERIRTSATGPRRALKDLLQTHGVPPWMRIRTPLVYCGDTLVCVPGIAIEAEAAAAPGEPGMVLEWKAV